MRFLFAFLLLAVSSSAFASGDRVWYVVSKYTCSLSNGVHISYDQTKDPNQVMSVLGFAVKPLYIDGTYYDRDSNLSFIGFTGHRPSAGPSFDPWESSYSVRFSGLLPTGVVTSVQAQIYKNQSYTGWTLMPVTVNCDVLVERTF